MDMTAAIAMDRMYRRQRHLYDVTRQYYLLGRDRLIAASMPAHGDHVLEIGCGTGRNLVQAAKRYRNAQFLGIDISREMLKSSERPSHRPVCQPRVRVAYADAADFNPGALFGRPRFARIFISYSLSMIPDWPARSKALAVAGGWRRIAYRGFRRPVAASGSFSRRFAPLAHALWRASARRTGTLASPRGPQRRGLDVERPYLGYAQYAVLRMVG